MREGEGGGWVVEGGGGTTSPNAIREILNPYPWWQDNDFRILMHVLRSIIG